MKVYIRKFLAKYFQGSVDCKVKLLNGVCLGGAVVSLFNLSICRVLNREWPIRFFSIIMLIGCLTLFIYGNCTNQYTRCYRYICIFCGMICFPILVLATNRIDSGVNYYYIIAIVLPFLMLEGKRLRIYVALDIVICIITYAISFSYINKYSFTSVEYVRKYTEVIMAVVVVGLALGIEFYYQIYVLQKQQKENERQRILLEELVEEMNIAKQEAEEAKQEAEYANKAKSKFLANMSHEIRTPMNAILGMATLINREEIDYNVRDKVEGIENATRSLLTIVNDILDISKIESGKMEIVEQCYQSSMVIHDVINIIQYKIVDQPIEFEVAISETLPCMLYGDSIRLRQILINLLSNAEKYTNEGKIHFSIDWVEQEENAQLIIKVQDTGIGIKEEDIEKLFTSFERLDVKRNHALEGTGLGLTICKQLLDLMQGSIYVESKYGEGSTFTVYLKQKILDKTPIQMVPYKKDKNNYTKDDFIAPEAKVLVVDDNLVNLKVAKGLLALYEMQIDTASSGKEALEILSYKDYDLIFMDHMMPDLDGIETVHIIREEKEKYNQHIPIIALTANAILGTKEAFLGEGFNGYLSKPIEVYKLEKILLEFLPTHLIQRIDHKKVKESKPSFKIEGIDVEKGLSNVEYNEALYIELLNTYHKETSKLKNEIIDFGEDLCPFIVRIHAIKGSSRNIGITQIADYAEQLEDAAHEKDIAFLQVHHEPFMVQLEQQLRAIDAFLDGFNKIKAINLESKLEKVYKETLDLDIVQKLYTGFETYDIEVIEAQLKALEPYAFPKPIEEFIHRLGEYLDELEYEKGVEEIQQYLMAE